MFTSERILAVLFINLFILRLGQCQQLLETSGSLHGPLRELSTSACQVSDRLAPEGSSLETACSLLPPLYFEYTVLAGFSPTTVEEKYEDCKRTFQSPRLTGLSYSGLKRCVDDDEVADSIEPKHLRQRFLCANTVWEKDDVDEIADDELSLAEFSALIDVGKGGVGEAVIEATALDATEDAAGQ